MCLHLLFYFFLENEKATNTTASYKSALHELKAVGFGIDPNYPTTEKLLKSFLIQRPMVQASQPPWSLKILLSSLESHSVLFTPISWEFLTLASDYQVSKIHAMSRQIFLDFHQDLDCFNIHPHPKFFLKSETKVNK